MNVPATADFIPAIALIGRLHDAGPVDEALHLVRDDRAEYEDFCRFRQVTVDFVGIGAAGTGSASAASAYEMSRTRARPSHIT